MGDSYKSCACVYLLCTCLREWEFQNDNGESSCQREIGIGTDFKRISRNQ